MRLSRGGAAFVLEGDGAAAREQCAAVLRRRRQTHIHRFTDSDGQEHRSPKRWIEERSKCGSFAVIDETGVAVVDDHAFRVVPLVGTLAAEDGVGLIVREGMVIEVAGPAERRHHPAARLLERADGYRDGVREALVFDGRADDPVHIFVPNDGRMQMRASRRET